MPKGGGVIATTDDDSSYRMVVGSELGPEDLAKYEELPSLTWGSLKSARLQLAAVEPKLPRTVFVAYPYSFSRNDYRESFAAVGQEFDVTILYADEQITNKQILDKIRGMIEQSTFSIFDITSWNPNVALELGIAVGLDEDYYILFDPSHDQTDVPSDLGGIDRLQYEDFASLRDQLRRLMEQQFGSPDEKDASASDSGESFKDLLEGLRTQVPGIVEGNPGIQMGGIASQLGVPIEYAQSITRPLLDSGDLETSGQRRGTRYYIRGRSPSEGDSID